MSQPQESCMLKVYQILPGKMMKSRPEIENAPLENQSSNRKRMSLISILNSGSQ